MSNKIVRPLKRPGEAAVERFYSDDGELVGGERPQYTHIRIVLAVNFSYLVVHLFPSGLVGVEIKFTVRVGFPKRPINWFK